MKLKTLKKKIRKLEARLEEGPAKLAKLKRKLEAAMKAGAMKARKKAATRAGGTNKATKSLTAVQKSNGVTAEPPNAAKGGSPAKKVKRKLNLSPERRTALAAAMKARWTAKRAAEAETQGSSTVGDFTFGQVTPVQS